MSEQIHKGWLTTRDNEKYAPATLIENVFTRNNLPYDQQVRRYLASINTANSAEFSSIKTQLENYGTTMEGLQDQIDENHSTILKKIQNFNGDEYGDKLFISDNSGNVIAYFDADGLHSVDVSIPGLTMTGVKSTLSKNAEELADIKSDIEGIGAAIANIDASDSDVFYIIDGKGSTANECNVIAYIDKIGVHSVNFYTEDSDYNSLVTSVENQGKDIDDLQQADKDLSEDIANVDAKADATNTRTANIKSDDYTNTLFIVDNNNNVIAYVDAAGIHAVNVLSGGANGEPVYDLNVQITDLNKAASDLDKAIQAETKARTEEDGKLADQIANNKTALDDLNLVFRHDQYTDKFFFIDSSGYVVAYVDKDGLHTVNVLLGTEKTDLVTTIAQLLAKDGELQAAVDGHDKELDRLSDDLADEKTTREDADKAINETLTGMQESFNWEQPDDETLLIVDGADDPNVLAKFDSAGLTVVDVVIQNVDPTTKLIIKEKNLRDKAVYMLVSETKNITWL